MLSTVFHLIEQQLNTSNAVGNPSSERGNGPPGEKFQEL